MKYYERFGIRSTRVVVPDSKDCFAFLACTVVIDTATGSIVTVVASPEDCNLQIPIQDFGDLVVMPGVIDINTSLSWDLGIEVDHFTPVLFSVIIFKGNLYWHPRCCCRWCNMLSGVATVD